jgi:hypothetical protein
MKVVLSLTVAVLASGVCPVSSAAPRLYEMTTATGMPHLDENLRYAVVHERRCLDAADLSRTFWMLDDVSLQDCRLVRQDPSHYRLQCSGGHGTSGDARWQLDDADALRGTLDVRLGGKNMTFWQRVTARAIGRCD